MGRAETGYFEWMDLRRRAQKLGLTIFIDDMFILNIGVRNGCFDKFVSMKPIRHQDL